MRILISILLLALLTEANAQRGPHRSKELESYKIAFLTRELDLSPAQAEKFWPVYNEFNEDRAELRLERGQLRMDINNGDIDEEEARRILEQDNLLKTREVELEKKYYDQFLEILPAQKVIALVRAEMDFNREILNRLRRQRMSQDGLQRREN